jgi:hypothetical protein
MSPELKVCENQVMLFFRYLDERQYDALAALIAPQGVWRRQGKALVGAEQILAALGQRSPTMRIVHLITNLACDQSDADHCSLRGYMLVVRHDPGTVTAGPLPLKGIESVRDLQVNLERHNGQWLISELAGEASLFAMNA